MNRKPLALAAALGVFLAIVACSSAPPSPEPEPTPAPRPSPSPSPRPSPAPRPSPSPTPSPAAPAEPPPVSDAQLARAKALYAAGDLAHVEEAVPSLAARLDRKDVPAAESEARALVRRSRIAHSLLASVHESPLARGERVERIEIQSGGHVTGRVIAEEKGRLFILSFGAETELAQEDVVSRTPLSRAEFEAVARARLAKQSERVNPDDALGHFRLAFYAWAYGLRADAMPHVDAVIDSDGFPVVARAFRPKQASGLVEEWTALTGRTVLTSDAVASRNAPAPSPAPSTAPSPAPLADQAPSADLAPIRALYEKGVARYRDSFGESKDPDRALDDARKLLGQARDLLDRAGPDSPEAEELRVEIQSLLFDVRKRSRV